MNFLQPLFNLINRYVFSFVLRFFMTLTGDHFAFSIFLFTLVVNLVLIPLSIKSQKSAVSQIKLKPKMDAIKKKYGDDRQKVSAATQKLYQEEKVSMGGGCLPMIIRLVLVMAVYYLVISPLTYLTTLSADSIKAAIEGLAQSNNYRAELLVVQEALKNGSGEIFEAIKNIRFDFFGIDLTQTPHFSMNFSQVTGEQLKLWIIPFLAFAAAMFSSVLSLLQQKRINPDAPNMAGMMLTMPILSLVIAFSAPAGLGFYWACSSLIGGVIQALVQEFYGPSKMVAKEQMKSVLALSEKEKKVRAVRTEQEQP